MWWSDRPRDRPIKQREHGLREAGRERRASVISCPAIDQHVRVIDRAKQRRNGFDHIGEVITGFFGKMREVPGGPAGLKFLLARPRSLNKVLSECPPLILVAYNISKKPNGMLTAFLCRLLKC
jgi:hypothetical protein